MLEFHETYCKVDVWVEFNNAKGQNEYVFWYGGKSYARETQAETRALIRYLTHKGVQR